MSTFAPAPIACPRCGHQLLAGTAESINVTRMPRARERILDGSFHRFACERCDERITVERDFLYTDLRREQFVHVFPPDREPDWPALEELAARTFRDGFDGAPPMLRESASRYRVRLVFGLRALADKLRVWDAGLDDAIVELQKLELFAASPALRERGDAAIDVVAVDGERLEVAASSLTGSWPACAFALARTRYETLAAARHELVERYPGLFHKPYVGFRRLARETLAPAETQGGGA